VSRRRAPRPVSAAVGSAVAAAQPATLLAAVQRVWPEAVGEAIAREATPVSEREGVVTVACRSATWAQELDLLSGRIGSQLERSLPDGAALEGLRFTASGDPD
jgi:predicted nucleic acid-binding Zn ribbon protein